jgi:hypothetical protein
MLIPCEQLFIQTFHHNGNLITEQGTGEKTPYFSWPSTPCLRQQPHENKTDQHTTYNTLKSVPAVP